MRKNFSVIDSPHPSHMSLKVKRKRTRFHISAPKLKLKDREAPDEATIPLLGPSPSLTPPPPVAPPIPDEFMDKSPFVSLDIKETVTNEVSRTVKKGKEVRMKKKDRRKLRREKWMEKLNACYKARELAKEAIKRRKTPIVGDLQPLLSALPDIEPNTAENTSQINTKRKKKKKKQDPTAYQEREVFQQVLSHPKYKADPLGTISLHIQNATALQEI